MKIVFMGHQNWGYVCLEHLLKHKDKYEIVAVFTHPKGHDKYESHWYKSVQELAEKNNLPVYAPENHDVNTKENTELIRSLVPDVILSAGWRSVVKKEILEIPKISINIHEAPLPRYRGHCPNNWTIINGEKETGITAHTMDVEVDGGNILSQCKIPIHLEDTIMDVYYRSLEKFPEVMFEALKKVEKGETGEPMDLSKSTYWGKRYPWDGVMDWNKSSMEIYNLVRALVRPYPGAFTYYEGKKLFIWKAKLADVDNYYGKPGQILKRSKNKGVLVRTGDGLIWILKVQPEDGGEMDAYKYLKETGKCLGINYYLEIDKLKKIIAKKDLSYNENKRDLSKRSDAHKSFAEKDIEAWIKETVQVKPGETVLDIGCGTGNQLVTYSSMLGDSGRIYACDLQQELLDKAKARLSEKGIKNIEFHRQNMDDKFPFDDDKFELVCSCFAIYYSNDPESLVKEIHRMLKKGGKIFIAGPTPKNTDDFWKLHEKVSGCPVSEKAMKRRASINDVFIPLVKKHFNNVRIEIFDNIMHFPSAESVMKYYIASPIFVEGVPDSEKERVKNTMLAEVEKEISANGKFDIKKQVYGVIGYK